MAAVTDAVTSPPKGRPMEKHQGPRRSGRSSSSSPARCCSLACSSPGRTSRSTTGQPAWRCCRRTAGTCGASSSGCSSITIVTLVVLTRLTEVEMSEDVSWDSIVLGLGGACALLAVVKNLTDANSTWESYGFVGLAVLVFAADVPELGRGQAERATASSPEARRVRLRSLTCSPTRALSRSA